MRRCLTRLWPRSSAGSGLLLRGLLLRNAVLPSMQLVNGGLAAPAPLAFNLSVSNSSLVLDGCTVHTSCDNLAQLAPWFSEQRSQTFGSATEVGG